MSNDYKEGKIKPPKMIAVAVLATKGESALVGWIEKIKRGRKTIEVPRRGYVQNDSIDGGKALDDVLAYALPVGPDPMNLDLHTFTVQLRKRNIWTKADFLKKRNSVIKSLLEAMEV